MFGTNIEMSLNKLVLVNEVDINDSIGSEVNSETRNMLRRELGLEGEGQFTDFFEHDTSVDGVASSLTSESLTSKSVISEPIMSETALSTLVMMRQQGSAIVLYALISYVIPTTLNELFIDKKSLATLIFGAFSVSFTMDAVKRALNASDHLKKDFNLYWGADAVQTVLLVTLACGFYFLGLGKHWSPVGYNAVVTVPGIALKLLTDFVLAPAAHKYLDKNHFVNQWLLPEKNDRVNEHKYSFRHYLALQLPLYCLLFSALIAGSEVFGTMKIAGTTTSVGEALVAFFKLCGAKSPATIYAVAMMFNEVVGMFLLMGAGWFPDMHWSLLTRTVTAVVVAAVFEALSTVIPFLNHENIVTLWFAMTMTFLVDRAVQYTIGPKIDKPVNQFVYTHIGEPIQKDISKLLSKCGALPPPSTVVENVVLNPVVQSDTSPV